MQIYTENNIYYKTKEQVLQDAVMCACRLFDIAEDEIHVQEDCRPSKISYKFIINRKVHGKLFYEFMNNIQVQNDIDDNVYHKKNQKIRSLYKMIVKPACNRGLHMLNDR